MCLCVCTHMCMFIPRLEEGLDMLELKSQVLLSLPLYLPISSPLAEQHLSQRAGSPAPKFMLLWSQIYLPRFIYLFYNKDFLMPRSEGKKKSLLKRGKKRGWGWGRGSPGALAQRLGAPAAFPVQFSWQLTASCSSSSRGPDTFILAKHQCVWNKNK